MRLSNTREEENNKKEQDEEREEGGGPGGGGGRLLNLDTRNEQRPLRDTWETCTLGPALEKAAITHLLMRFPPCTEAKPSAELAPLAIAKQANWPKLLTEMLESVLIHFRQFVYHQGLE